MSWDRALSALFDDLEQQAEGLALAARDVDVAEHGRAAYATVDLESRVHASVDAVVTCELLGGHRVRGAMARAGRGWMVLEPEADRGEPPGAWVVHLACVVRLSGLDGRALPEAARGVTARLGLGSVLRRLAESREPVVVALADGALARGQVGRVGADFVELLGDGTGRGSGRGPGPRPAVEVLPLSAVAAVRGG